jgi:hypothetical protein
MVQGFESQQGQDIFIPFFCLSNATMSVMVFVVCLPAVAEV